MRCLFRLERGDGVERQNFRELSLRLRRNLGNHMPTTDGEICVCKSLASV